MHIGVHRDLFKKSLKFQIISLKYLQLHNEDRIISSTIIRTKQPKLDPRQTQINWYRDTSPLPPPLTEEDRIMPNCKQASSKHPAGSTNQIANDLEYDSHSQKQQEHLQTSKKQKAKNPKESRQEVLTLEFGKLDPDW